MACINIGPTQGGGATFVNLFIFFAIRLKRETVTHAAGNIRKQQLFSLSPFFFFSFIGPFRGYALKSAC